MRLCQLILTAALLPACASKSLDFAYEQRGCENIDPDNVPQSKLVQTKEGNNLVFYRDWVYRPASALFEPTFGQDGDGIEVREYWVEPEDTGAPSDAETCFRPTVVVQDPEPGDFTLFWYIGDDTTPFDNVAVVVE